jgi:hypothetical protein
VGHEWLFAIEVASADFRKRPNIRPLGLGLKLQQINQNSDAETFQLTCDAFNEPERLATSKPNLILVMHRDDGWHRSELICGRAR